MATLEDRVTVLERDMTQLREEWVVVQQAPLIQARLLNSLRETQVEQGRDIAQLKGDVSVLKGDVSVLKGDVSELRLGQGTIIGMLSQLLSQDGGSTD